MRGKPRAQALAVMLGFLPGAAAPAALVEWFAKQPSCNGKSAMWGGSYAGFDQWATLKEFPAHLAMIVSVASAHTGVDFSYDSNIAPLYLMMRNTPAYWNSRS
jgi:predicted acyl esterase